MKRLFFTAAAFFMAAYVFAYNPPVGGQTLFNLSSPTQLASASSCAGGGIFMPGADSIAFNPALPALEQRIQLDAAFSALISTNSDDDRSFNAAFQTGILIPTKRFVASGILNGVFCKSIDLWLGNTLNFRAGLSKEVSEKLSVGANVNAGVLWGAGSDWSLGLDAGFLYRLGQLGFFRDFRIGAAALNLGKYYSGEELLPIDAEHTADDFPSLVTIRGGIGALLFETEQVKGGFSFDIATPAFQNVIFDMGLQFAFKDMLYLSVAESIDVMEIKNEHYNLMPAISLGVKFDLNARGNEYLKSRSWDSNEMLASLAWQQKYEHIQAISGGARLYLGQTDTQPPVIQLWNGAED